MSLGLLFLGVFCTYFLVRLIEKTAPSLGLMDVPNHRSAHVNQTPRGGGLAIVLVFLLLQLVFLFFVPERMLLGGIILFGLFLVALVGLVDDLRSVSWQWRLLVHFLFAALLLWQTGLPDAWLTHLPLTLLVPLTLLATVWWINLYNFMDGADGFAASEALFLGGALVLFAWIGADLPFLLLSLAFVAVVLGFFPRNFPPAKIFMGDVGSGFLGATLAAMFALALNRGVVGLPGILVLTLPFWLDASWTLSKRLLARERVWEAHRDHFYQRIVHEHSHFYALRALTLLNLFLILPLAYWSEV